MQKILLGNLRMAFVLGALEVNKFQLQNDKEANSFE